MILRLFRTRAPGPWPSPDIANRIWSETGVFDHLDETDWSRLLALAAELLREKRIVGAGGFAPDAHSRWSIALQACLPMLHHGLGAYRGFVDIIVYPDLFLVERQEIDGAGVVHESRDALAGEAIDHGPVILSWPDVVSPRAAGCNVVIHEFLHKLDLLDGDVDGIPPMRAGARAAWSATLEAAFDAFCAELHELERRIPIDVDPESPDADAIFAELALDPYAATDPGEFFAVAGEAFFSDPLRIAQRFPELYRAFRDYFRQDPISRPLRPRGRAPDPRR